MDLEIDHGAVLNGKNGSAEQDVIGGVNTFGKVEQLVLGGAQLLDHLIDAGGVQFGNAQPGFADVLFDPGNLRHVAAAAADDFGPAALQGKQPRFALKALLKQHQYGIGFLGDEQQSDVLGGDLPAKANNFFVELGNALPQDGDLAGQGLSPGVENTGLAVDYRRHFRIVMIDQQPVRECDLIVAVALGNESGLEGGVDHSSGPGWRGAECHRGGTAPGRR